MTDAVDVVVVGGGSAGCVLAARLSEDPDRTVLLLEAGPDYSPYEDARWPEDFLDGRRLALESHDWGFAGGEDAARAKILGGCSSHNACDVLWAAPGDHARWVELGNPGWGFREQAAYLERAETQLRTRAPESEELTVLEASFLEAVDEIGLSLLEGPNGPDWGSGAAPIAKNMVGVVRWNSAFAYLDPVRARPNLNVQAETLVDRIVFDGTRPAAVLARRAGAEERVAADLVVLAAGAYMSPAILRRSGIGPEDDAARLGPVVVALPGVGQNLLDHPRARVTFAPTAELATTAPDVLENVMLKAPGSRCSDGSWDTHVLPGLWSSSDGSRLEVTFEIWAVEASSVGRVRVVSSDPEKLPVLEQPFSALSDHDLTVLVEGIELVRRLAGSSVLAPFVAEELEPGPSRDLERWVREHSGGYWHPVGTCRMGPAGNPDAVVDAVGRVHGIDGVVVADASIFPTIPRANTNLPTMGAAEYIASTLAAADAKEESTEPPPDYKGILQSPTPLGPNRISAHEERIDSFSYQVGTQLDNLNHIGVGQVFYGGRRGREIAETWGTNSLGSEHAGPIVTRGILLDVLGLKLVQGASDDLEAAPNGAPHLAATYRITLEDLEAAMRQARIQTIERGDVVLIRTGWNQLLEPHDPTSPHAPDDPTHPGHPGHQAYLRSEPGIYLREARWLASRRPAIVGADNWALEVLGDPVVASNVFPVHQELITHFGIRIGEAIVTDRLAADRLFEFVYIVTPQLAFGATAGNTPPCALGQPR